MPENTVTTSLAPMELEDVVNAFAYIRALQADDRDIECRTSWCARESAGHRREAHRARCGTS